jgi:exodeoxyribonuclease V alpha subunit
MEPLEALETYLIETGQIHPLAKRQARLLCRSVADESLQQKAQIFLLLNCAALNLGAPRAPREFLLKPLREDSVKQHTEVYENEHPGISPGWKDIITDPDSIKTITSALDETLRDPLRYAPLTGAEPQDENGRTYPLLVIGMQQNACAGFSRYWRAAASLEKELYKRLQLPSDVLSDEKAAQAVKYVFGADSILEGNGRFHYRQIFAAALALRTRFLIVSGGPGTGKTMVVTQILRTLMHAYKELEPDRIVLCAPTGRAKARLGESIDRGIDFLEKKTPIGKPEARLRDLSLKNLVRKTIHSLLGARPDGSTKYHSGNPLSYKVIVVDEASMVDLCLFAALMDAAALDCRIILVGDMHQLPSVEAGAVLGDLTDRFAGMDGCPTLTTKTADWAHAMIKDVTVEEAGGSMGVSSLILSTPDMLQKAGRLADHAVILTHSYRSVREILDISEQVNRGDAGRALLSITRSAEGPSAPECHTGNDGSSAVTLDTSEGIGPIKNWLKDWYSNEKLEPLKALKGLDIDTINDPSHQDHSSTLSRLNKAFEVFDKSRILTLAHEGQRGRISINLLADKLLRPTLDDGSRKQFFHGQQVILGQNLHDLDLYNGDTGMVVESKNAGQKVVFRRGRNYSIHSLERLTGLEPAFAMTVHKAQGSEFDAVLLVLPEYESPLLTRQVLYTGLTRAKSRIRVLGTRAHVQAAIATREERPGGVEL